MKHAHHGTGKQNIRIVWHYYGANLQNNAPDRVPHGNLASLSTPDHG
jgi:hypothetical protein